MQKMQHITEKELDILHYFYIWKRGHVRRIKKEAKISEHTLLKYLETLEKKGVLNSGREGNLKIYELNTKNQLAKIFFSYFDFERIESLEYKRGKAIKMFVSLLKEAGMPYFVLLFGSTAKGAFTAKSDIDLIAVYGSISRNIADNIENIKRNVLAETGLKVNAIVMAMDGFMKEKVNKSNYALQDAVATGYPVFGSQIYYEAIWD
ncbi:MAG: nucleotidyltransferase domain-containing protein [Nanoarchaeota archaeon]|nr:nucleotidyltransferase domain-containing protein [Nanoarchaeota archaeon]